MYDEIKIMNNPHCRVALKTEGKPFVHLTFYYQPRATWYYIGSHPPFPFFSWDLLLPFFLYDLSTTKTPLQVATSFFATSLNNRFKTSFNISFKTSFNASFKIISFKTSYKISFKTSFKIQFLKPVSAKRSFTCF